MGAKEHKKNLIKCAKIGIITLSSTRTLIQDQSGQWIAKQAKNNGHEIVYHQVIDDNNQLITQTIKDVISQHNPNVILMNGGTGISNKDVTIESVRPLFQKELTGFGILFTQLSFKQINSAAILSRATAGIINKTIVFCMPGSLNACKLACNEIIFPEIGHLIKHIYEK